MDQITSLAFINTDIAASFAAITWLIIEWSRVRKPRFVGLLTGAVAGLATITPAAAFVPTWGAALIGLAAGIVCYLAVEMKNALGWDDALDVWGVHGVGGALGIILLGVLGSTAVNAAGADGLFFGGSEFFFKQVAAVAISSVYAFAFTWAMLWLIDRVTPVKTTQEMEMTLDESLHGEQAYLA